jgi:hypothetical protein
MAGVCLIIWFASEICPHSALRHEIMSKYLLSKRLDDWMTG